MNDIITKVNNFVSKKYDNDEYNWIHNEYVAQKALELGKKLNADLEILEIAARFHDIDYSRGKEFHTQDSADLAEKFLLGIKYPKDKVAKVKLVILCHTSSVIKTIKNPPKEGKILHDADKMWAMTPMGFARTIAHEYIKNTSYKFMVEGLENQLKLFNALFFDESRKMVKEDRKVCVEFLKRLKNE